MKSFFWILSLFIFTGCSHYKVSQNASSCRTQDWYEIGRQDGRSGENLEKIKKWELLCRKNINKKIYEVGYKKGLKKYCSAENGFELGKTNVDYKNNCGTKTKINFLQAYSAGQKKYQDQEAHLLEEYIKEF